MGGKPFQIYRLATLLETPGANVTFERQQEQAWQLIRFLRNNNLIADNCLPVRKEELDTNFKLLSSDVTEEGLAVLRNGFYKWLDKNDDVRSMTFNMAPLEKALTKVREQKLKN